MPRPNPWKAGRGRRADCCIQVCKSRKLILPHRTFHENSCGGRAEKRRFSVADPLFFLSRLREERRPRGSHVCCTCTLLSLSVVLVRSHPGVVYVLTHSREIVGSVYQFWRNFRRRSSGAAAATVRQQDRRTECASRVQPLQSAYTLRTFHTNHGIVML